MMKHLKLFEDFDDMKNNKTTELRNFILNERLGINDDIIKISNDIYDSILNKKSDIIAPKNNIKIEKIHINYFNDNSSTKASFNINKSNLSKIILNINTNYNISVDTIRHELNHALQFLFVGKDKSIRDYSRIKAIESSTFISPKDSQIFQNFLMYKYFSDKSEINSYIYNLEYELRDLYNENKDYFLQNYEFFLKTTTVYSVFEYIKNYDIYELKQLDSDILIKYINIIEDNYDFIIKHNSKLSYFIRSIYQIIFKKKYLNNLTIKISNINDYLNKQRKIQNESVDYMFSKMLKLYDLFNIKK